MLLSWKVLLQVGRHFFSTCSRLEYNGTRFNKSSYFIKGPFAGLVLADYGASVLRIIRPHSTADGSLSPPPTADFFKRHKSSLTVDLKSNAGIALLKELLKHVDVLIDPFRPGVIEALGLEPSTLQAANPRLIVARLTGFRRNDEYAGMAGHDINYLAVSGVLSQLGRENGPPYPPANLLGDFAGGGLTCALGIILALFNRTRSGQGQTTETNMVDGAAYLATMPRHARKTPLWNRPRGHNLLDGGCPWYDVYACKDNSGYMAVGALESPFYQTLLQGLGLNLPPRTDRTHWPTLRSTLRATFLQKTRAEWTSIFAGTDACCTPVIPQDELETRGYEQRLPMRLAGSPGRPIGTEDAWGADGSSGEALVEAWMGGKLGEGVEVGGEEAGAKVGKAKL